MNGPMSRGRVAPVALSVAAALSGVGATAADQAGDSRSLDQVTVIAPRIIATARGEAAARADVARVPGGAAIVSHDEYADGRASTLADVFAFTPGVFAQSRFGAEEARLSIRGSGLQRTFHMRGIYLLQDGVPITLADGGGDFQAIEPLALAYTEVLRGANALEYGGSTLGGSINFISPSGHDGGGIRPRVEGGSFGYRRALVSVADVLGASDYFASVSSYEQDGFRDWSRQENQRFFGNVGFKLSERLDSRFYLSAVHTDSQLPGALTRAQLDADPEEANAGSFAGRQKRDFDLYRLANRTVLDLYQGFLELSAGYSYKDLWHPIFQLLQQRSDDYNVGARFVREGVLAGRTNRLIVGVTPSWNRVKDDRFVNIAGEKGARTAESMQRSRNLSVYAEDHLDLNEQWTLVAGAQWMDATRRYDDRLLANGDQSLDASYTQLSPKLGFLWQMRRDWLIFGNLSDSFEPPSFGELSGGPGVNLLDEQRARTVEIGTRGTAARIHWDVSAYSAAVRDELLSLNTPSGQPLGTVNAPRTVHRGVELGADIALTPTMSWRSAYLWSDFHFDENGTYGDNTLPGIPKHFYRGELTWTPFKHYFITLNTEVSPDRYAVDMARSLFANSYAIWGVKVGRSVSHGLSWFVEGRNLSNRAYAATTGVIADAGGADSAQFYPGDGRAVYVGLSWQPPAPDAFLISARPILNDTTFIVSGAAIGNDDTNSSRRGRLLWQQVTPLSSSDTQGMRLEHDRPDTLLERTACGREYREPLPHPSVLIRVLREIIDGKASTDSQCQIGGRVDIATELLGPLPNLQHCVRIGWRLVAAVFVGALIGYERERTGKAAGFRTHILVAIGTALFVICIVEAEMGNDALSRVIQGLAHGDRISGRRDDYEARGFE